jgi:hypothetical protein
MVFGLSRLTLRYALAVDPIVGASDERSALLSWLARLLRVLPDYLRPALTAVFAGTSVSRFSAARGYSYSNTTTVLGPARCDRTARR